jgi:hypothetical protein
LLSVVAQAFALVVFIYLCAGEDLPPSGDADEGCQWEIQTDELGSLLGLAGVGRSRRSTLF